MVDELDKESQERVARCQCGGDRIRVRQVEDCWIALCRDCYKACTRGTRQEAISRWNKHTTKMISGEGEDK